MKLMLVEGVSIIDSVLWLRQEHLQQLQQLLILYHSLLFPFCFSRFLWLMVVELVQEQSVLQHFES
jgi:hypothetical protein